VRGVLRIFRTPPAPTAVLEDGATCIPLALPADIFADYKRWNGKSVTVVGLVYSHGVTEGVISYELEGRTVIGSMCQSSFIVLFVTGVQAR